MATKKTNSGSKKLGLIGCGTPEMIFRSQARKHFGNVEGVVGIEVTNEKIVLRVTNDEVVGKLPKTFRRRKVESVVVGAIRKQTVR